MDITEILTYGAYIVLAYFAFSILKSIFTPRKRAGSYTQGPPYYGDDGPAVAPVSGEDLGPVSTPSSLASRSGLGGGQLVGAQSKKLGGSTFKFAGKKVPVPGLQDHFYEWNAPSNNKLVAPKPAPKPGSIKAKSGPTPLTPAPKLVAPPKKLKGDLPPDNFLSSEQVVVESRNGEIVQAR